MSAIWTMRWRGNNGLIPWKTPDTDICKTPNACAKYKCKETEEGAIWEHLAVPGEAELEERN